VKPDINNSLYTKCTEKHLTFTHVSEVGVYLPETSNIILIRSNSPLGSTFCHSRGSNRESSLLNPYKYRSPIKAFGEDNLFSGRLERIRNIIGFIKDKIKTTLVEPDPKNIAAINSYFKDYPNIQLFPYAIFDYDGTLELVQRASSTFVSTLNASPALVNDRYKLDEKDKFTVECRRFDSIDDGSIDLLSIDTEGCEWYVIKNMRSRPAVISLETHGKGYTNPFSPEINSWFQNNNYTLWYKDGSDSVYFRIGLFELSSAEKRSLSIMDIKLSYWRLKHQLKNKLKSVFS
jgi:FkbM family methyltransferase